MRALRPQVNAEPRVSQAAATGSDARVDAVRVVVRRSFGRSACRRTRQDSAAFALTLRAPEEDPRRRSGVSFPRL